MAELRRSLLGTKFWRETARVLPSPTVPISRERRESLEHTISSRVVSHAISDLAGRYANCIPSFGGFEEIRVYVRAAAFSRGVYIRHGLARTGNRYLRYLRLVGLGRWALPFITMTSIVPYPVEKYIIGGVLW